MKLVTHVMTHPRLVHSHSTTLVRCLYVSHSCPAYQPRGEFEPRPHRGQQREWPNQFGQSNRMSDHPYHQLFPWKSLREFSQHLADSKVYFDGNLLAISKPWGVGIYRANIEVTPRNSHLAKCMVPGSCNYSLADSLDHLSQIFEVKRLKLVKTINRFSSGIVLLAANKETEVKVEKALRRAIAGQLPAKTFWCVTKGWPTINDDSLRERVGAKLLELDELGDHKQTTIVGAEQLTNKMRRRKEPQADGMTVQSALVELKMVGANKSLGVSCVQLSTNVTKWNFIECYLAYKASFVLGDTRFSQQVKHILGTPMSIKPDRINFTEDVEPLNPNVRNKLMVRGNGHIPVLIHHKRIVLPSYLNKKKKEDLVIDSTTLPDYFAWTLKTLDIDTTKP